MTEVRFAIVERNGSVSVFKNDEDCVIGSLQSHQ